MDDALAKRPSKSLPKIRDGTHYHGRPQKVTPILGGMSWPLPCQQVDQSAVRELHLIFGRTETQTNAAGRVFLLPLEVSAREKLLRFPM
jgi:hypothetical protein